MGGAPGPIERHHGAPETAREDHEHAFREGRGVVATAQLAIGYVVVAAIVVGVIAAVLRGFG